MNAQSIRSRSGDADSEVPSVRIDLRPDDLATPIARAAVRRTFRFRNEDAESSFLVALTEIVTNAVAEHRRLEIDFPVRLTIVLSEAPFVAIADRGAGLDPRRARDDGADVVPEPEVEAGRGLIVARGFVPTLEFETGPDGTTARLPLAGLAESRSS
jgi:serine/threonine-protein kinase RsbW